MKCAGAGDSDDGPALGKAADAEDPDRASVFRDDRTAVDEKTVVRLKEGRRLERVRFEPDRQKGEFRLRLQNNLAVSDLHAERGGVGAGGAPEKSGAPFCPDP